MLFKYIEPCSPVLAKAVLAGDDWQHEVKFDGFRVQIHKLGDEVELYGSSGGRFSQRFYCSTCFATHPSGHHRW
jgi:bifunctional non-homologous end joining protein LigD